MALPNDVEVAGRLKILSLDGGGVRGLSSLLILQYLMRDLGLNLEPKRPDIKPCDYFDLIGGTSTGGIIALMLGRMRMSVEDCIEEYIQISKQVFSDKKFGSQTKYSAETLEGVMKDVISKYLADRNQDAPLRDPRCEDACKTLVTSLQRLHAAEPTVPVLRTYDHAGRIDCTIWQAARATSAAATFFKPISIGNPSIEYIDAGLGYNNPGRALLMEATSFKKNDGSKYKRKDIGLFLSIGTGIPAIFRPNSESRFKEFTKAQMEKLGIPEDVIKQMKEIVTAAERAAFELKHDFLDLGTSAYFRFNVDQGLQGVELDEYDHKDTMVADTNAYMRKEGEKVEQCVERMRTLDVYDDISLSPDEVVRDARAGKSPMAVALNPESYGISLPTYLKRETSLRREQREDLDLLTQDAETWKRTVLADILDKRPRAKLNDFYQRQDVQKLRASNDPSLRDVHVKIQMKTSPDTYAAKKLVEGILLEECKRLLEGKQGLGYYWAAHRYAGILVLMEDLSLAKKWFTEAYEGRKAVSNLPGLYKSMIRSKEGLEKVERRLECRAKEQSAQVSRNTSGKTLAILAIMVTAIVFAYHYIPLSASIAPAF